MIKFTWAEPDSKNKWHIHEFNEQEEEQNMGPVEYAKLDMEAANGDNTKSTGENKPDMVNHPSHYNQTGIECIDAIRAATGDGFQYHLQGTVLKYLWRYRYKNGVEDLRKAEWYLKELIKELDNGKD